MQPSDVLEQLVGRNVVLDMVSPFVMLGRLAALDEKYFLLEEADVHDLRDTTTTREVYVRDARRFGINPNRGRVLIRAVEVVAISALDDVCE